MTSSPTEEEMTSHPAGGMTSPPTEEGMTSQPTKDAEGLQGLAAFFFHVVLGHLL
jgi:hypothetical protein